MIRVSTSMKGAMSLICVGLAGALMAGCGAAGVAAPRASTARPESPRQARAELARLERQIDGARKSLGLPSRADETAGAPAPASKSTADPAPVFEPPPARASRPAVAADQEADQERMNNCSDNCRLSRAICHAARRICSIAGYLGDSDAAGRCKRARQDCRQAREAKPEDCSGCR